VKAQDPRIILITPSPVDETCMQESSQIDGIAEIQRVAKNTALYANAAREVGEELGVVTLDLWTVMMEKAGWRDGDALAGAKELGRNEVFTELMHDGLHFNPMGYKVLYEELMKTIEKHWPDQHPDNLGFIFPSWEEAPK
jgi:lysophospholipase L1-like esterase